MIVYIRATNDANGNPRRGWIVEENSTLVFYSEGYLGLGALPVEYRKSGERGVMVNVSPSEFRRAKKLYSKKEGK